MRIQSPDSLKQAASQEPVVLDVGVTESAKRAAAVGVVGMAVLNPSVAMAVESPVSDQQFIEANVGSDPQPGREVADELARDADASAAEIANGTINPAVAPASVAYSFTHVAVEGDTLNRIAGQYGVDANNLGYQGDPTKLPVGHELNITVNGYYLETGVLNIDELAAQIGVPSSTLQAVNTNRETAQVFVPINSEVIEIKDGQTLAQISEQTGASISELMRLNALPDANKIYSGEKLAVPVEPEYYDEALNESTTDEESSNTPVVNEALLPEFGEAPRTEYEATRPSDTFFVLPKEGTVAELAELLISNAADIHRDYTVESLTRAILDLNDIQDPKTLQPGKILYVPETVEGELKDNIQSHFTVNNDPDLVEFRAAQIVDENAPQPTVETAPVVDSEPEVVEPSLPMQYIVIREGLTASLLAEALMDPAGGIDVYINNYSSVEQLTNDILGANDPTSLVIGAELPVGFVTADVAAEVQEVADQVARENSAPSAASLAADSLPNESLPGLEVDPGAIEAQLIDYNNVHDVLENSAVFPLMTPPNLGEVNSEGYYLMPTPLDGTYQFSPNAPFRSRCGTLPNIMSNYTVAYYWNQLYPENPIIIGDLNEEEGHATHNNGTDVDITVVGRIAANTEGDSEKSLQLAKLYALTGEVRQILFNDEDTLAQFNAWAAENNIGTVMTWYDNHHHHFHVDFLNEYNGPYSGQCAPDTQEGEVDHDHSEPVSEAPVADGSVESSDLPNIENIESINGVPEERIESIVEYLITEHDFSARGAAYFAGNILQESSGNPAAVNQGEQAYGLAQWRGSRLTADFPYAQNYENEMDAVYAQLDFAVEEMKTGYTTAYDAYTNTTATHDQLSAANYEFERYGHRGNRDSWGAQIATWLGI